VGDPTAVKAIICIAGMQWLLGAKPGISGNRCIENTRGLMMARRVDVVVSDAVDVASVVVAVKAAARPVFRRPITRRLRRSRLTAENIKGYAFI